jgi:hypothetical protein
MTQSYLNSPHRENFIFLVYILSLENGQGTKITETRPQENNLKLHTLWQYYSPANFHFNILACRPVGFMRAVWLLYPTVASDVFLHLLCSAIFLSRAPLHNNNKKIITPPPVPNTTARTTAAPTTPTTPHTNASKRNETKTIMARTRLYKKTDNKDGTYTYEKLTVAEGWVDRIGEGWVEITEEEYRARTNKRPAEDGGDDSQRLKRSKSVVPETAKPSAGGEKTDSFVKRLETWVDMKTKSGDVDLTNITYGFLVDGHGAKDLSPEEVKERFKILGDYAKAVTARSEFLYQENDTLRKKVTAIKEKVTSNGNCVVELQGHIKKLQSTVEHLEKSNKEIIGGLQEAFEERLCDENILREQITDSFNDQIVELKKENEQLKKRLNLQEL